MSAKNLYVRQQTNRLPDALIGLFSLRTIAIATPVRGPTSHTRPLTI